MKAKSIKGKSAEEIQSALEKSLADGFKPTLALVFISVKRDISSIMRLLSDKDIQIFGATTGGEISDSDISHQGISVLLLDMNPANFRVLYEDYAGKKVAEVAKTMTEQALTIFSRPAFLLSNSIDKPQDIGLGEKILLSVSQVAGNNGTIWGGAAGDDL
ncbi:FIST N-terminal domain-containing protein, partial [Aquiflexum sp.]|uniref:FIST N-terminal domain-containing protein n=1 Tax=Aquiflexum sp. TaxID=1872584 RepID=UPI003593F684